MSIRCVLAAGAAALLIEVDDSAAQVCRPSYVSYQRHAVSFGKPVYRSSHYSSCSTPYAYSGGRYYGPRYTGSVYCGPYGYSGYYVSPRSGFYTSEGVYVRDRSQPSVVSFSAGEVDRSRVPIVVESESQSGVHRAPSELEDVRRRSSIIVRPERAGVEDAEASADPWVRLGRGDSRGALRLFSGACRAENLPDGDEQNLADVKAGYALSAYKLDDDARMVWALRRAVQEDVEGLHYLPISPEVREIVESMRDDARAGAEQRRTGGAARDGWFVASAASYLLHDYEGASEALAKAEAAGDQSRSAESLRAALREIDREADGPDGAESR